MPGLLIDLDVAFEGDGDDGILGVVNQLITTLQTVIELVGNLTDESGGSDALAALGQAIDELPLPEGLIGLGRLPELVADLGDPAGGFDPEDLLPLLEPVLEPLTRIADLGVGADGLVNLRTGLDLIVKVVALATGESFGASAMPAGDLDPTVPRFGVPGDWDPGVAATRAAEADALLQEFGPTIDADWLIAMLPRLASHWDDVRQWPYLPVLTDLFEVVGTGVRWAAMDGAELTADIDQQLANLGFVIATPRREVVDPLLAQIDAAATLPAALDDAVENLVPLLDRVAAKVRDGAKPTYSEVATIERHVAELSGPVGSVTVEGRPLGRLDDLVKDLELHLMQAVRIFVPPVDATPVVSLVDRLVAGIPDVGVDVFGDVVAEIEGLDLAALLDPLGSVTGAVQEVVDDVTAGLTTVEIELTALLSPVADQLDQLITDTGLADLQTQLGNFPGQVDDFVSGTIEPAIAPIRDQVTAAVTAVDGAVQQFDPEVLLAPIRDALAAIGDLINRPEVAEVLAEVEQALRSATDALASLDFSGAGDAAVELMEEIEAILNELGTIPIPEPAIPVIEGAVHVVTDLDFTVDVAEPIFDTLETVVEEGPAQVLDALQSAMDEFRAAVERFKPSEVVGDTLDGPLDEVLAVLDDFTPSQLLDGIGEQLSGVVDQVNLIDPAPLIEALRSIHEAMTDVLARVEPSTLLAPVDAAIETAIADLFEVTGIDDVFDGIGDVMAVITTWLEAVDQVRLLLDRVASMLADPGELGPALDGLVQSIVAGIDDADIAALAPRFAEVGAIIDGISAGVIASDVTRGLRSVQHIVPEALGGPASRRLTEAARGFPVHQLRSARTTPVRDRLIEAMDQLLDQVDGLERAPGPWATLSAEIEVVAPRFEAELTTYRRLSVVDGQSVFADCILPTPTASAVRASVEAAVRDGLEVPITALWQLFAAIRPHVSMVASGLSQVVGAVHARADEVVGDDGLGGLTGSLDSAADLLRDIDLDPVTGPLDAIHGRMQVAVDALDPAPIEGILQAAADALVDLLDLSTLIDPAASALLDQTYSTAVAALAALRPSELVADVLDPEYVELVAAIQPLFELPGQLKELLLAATAELSTEIVEQLARVEVAFDAMLRAIPIGSLGGGSGSVSGGVTVSGEVSVGAGVGGGA